MRIDIIKSAFPQWAAAAALIKDHSEATVEHTKKAVQASDLGARLDSSVRAMTSLDHAIDNVGKLPVKWVFADAGTYLAGYEAAKQAVTLIVASGLIPGARQRVGYQQLQAAVDTFKSGVDVASSDRSKFGAKYASGWLDATLEDTTAAVLMLRPGFPDAVSLLKTLKNVRGDADAGRPINAGDVKLAGELFGKVGSKLQQMVLDAEQGAATSVAVSSPTIERDTNKLLEKTQIGAQELLKGAPRVVD